ncbi:MAG: 3'-5' exonuclease domain-containing protein 2 [Bacteroidales bacterium]|nr:3'-5' exonuclease domain-containing protein 2 [Bacteroidales bacterium]MDE6802320.1 3'-5' exonuclease domain-containing protein 2 [Muribaculaceae bacterium]
MLSIDKSQIHQMPVAKFPGKIYVIDNAADARSAVAYLMRQSAVGFDTETRPTFRKGETHNVALVQISTSDECFLFRVNLIGFCEPLRQLMESRDVLKIGLSTKDDFHGLARLAPIVPGGIIELQHFVGKYDITDQSLQKVYAIIFGEHITKGQRLTNWEAKTLTPAQQDYASLDAWACLRIYRHLSEGLFDPATSPYVKEQ